MMSEQQSTRDADDIREGDEITLRHALRRIVEASLANTNSRSAESMASWCRAVAATALESATRIDTARDTAGSAEDEGRRKCTCHPDDNPPRPCPRKFALSECREAALRVNPATQSDVDAAWTEYEASTSGYTDEDLKLVEHAFRAGHAANRSGTDAGARGRAIEDVTPAMAAYGKESARWHFETQGCCNWGARRNPSVERMPYDEPERFNLPDRHSEAKAAFQTLRDQYAMRAALEAALASAPAPTRTDDTIARLVVLLERAREYVDSTADAPATGLKREIDAALAELRAGEDRR